MPTPRRPLVAPQWRPWAYAAVALCGALLLAGCVVFHDGTGPSAFDAAVARRLYWHTGGDFARVTLGMTDAYLTITLLVVIALGAVALRRWDLALVLSVTPVVSIVLTEWILKPIVHRELTFTGTELSAPAPGWGAFPSGHETGLATLTAELALLSLRTPFSTAVRAMATAVFAIWTVFGAIGLVRNLYHYATDTIGGVCVAVVCVVGAALVADAVSSRVARSPASTARAA